MHFALAKGVHFAGLKLRFAMPAAMGGIRKGWHVPS
jgi:hypothetical protein